MYWIFAIILLFIIVLLSPIYINLEFNWNKTFKTNINFTLLFGLINRRIYSKEEKIKDTKDKNILVRLQKIKKVYGEDKKYISYFWDKCEIVEVRWITVFGFEDASITGIANGVLWSIKNTIIGLLVNNRNAKNIYINIVPNFEEKKFETDFNCIIKIKTVYIIVISLYVFITKKGGEIIVRSSY